MKKKIILVIILLSIIMISTVSANSNDSNDKLTNNQINNKISHTTSIQGEKTTTTNIVNISKNTKTSTNLRKTKTTPLKSENTTKNTYKSSILSIDGYINAKDALNYLNEFRTTKGVWYWAKDDKTKIYFNTNTTNQLQELVWDTDLEKIAKIRAKEITKLFSHTRPDGTTCLALYPDNMRAAGENIAMGPLDAKSVTEAFKEDNEPYNGQGHRRNMLYSEFNCIGIAAYQIDGTTYWVQTFGKKDNIQYDTKYKYYTYYYIYDYNNDYYDEYEPVQDAYITSKKIQYNTNNYINIGWKGNFEGYFQIYQGNKQIYTYYFKDYNGNYNYKPPKLNVGKYTTKLISNNKTIAKGKLIIQKATPQITAKTKKFNIKTKNKKYTITLKNNQKKAMKNKLITLKIKNKTYKTHTNQKGVATFQITKLNKKGTYTATITYKGNKNYKKISKKVKITIK